MFDELKKYKNNGHFFLSKGGKLSEVCNAPEKPGVYLVHQLCKGKVELVYIGSSGTISQKGKFGKLLLKSTLINGKQEGIPRHDYFEQQLAVHESDALDIYWWVTFDEKNNHLPAYVESLLLQRHFEIYGRLPLWNKEF
jgi:hypothetical protein